MSGVVDFYLACLAHDVNPVIGFEAYMAKEHRTERPTRRSREDDSGGTTEEGHKVNYHLTLLAENNEGYKNLVKLSSRAYLEGYYYKPRLDWELLEEHSEGVIATSGCLGGQVLQALLNESPAEALKIAARLQDIFGKDNFFVEIQNHGISAQRNTMSALLDVAAKLQAPLLATNDSHYVHQEDAFGHDILLCSQTKSLMSDTERFKFESDQHYLKTAEEMRSLFSEVPSSCDNTLLIAERANVKLDFDKPHLPVFPVPDWFDGDVDAFLTDLVFKGADRRWPDMPDEVVSRLAFELRTIIDMGFSSYFLIMWDIVSHAKSVGIRTGAGRGSAAGCAVSYCLGITDVDPIKYDLLFERFLNPSRISMPDQVDFDISFDDIHSNTRELFYGYDRTGGQLVSEWIVGR
jgi:DNA polymerase-3 subunit alpha